MSSKFFCSLTTVLLLSVFLSASGRGENNPKSTNDKPPPEILRYYQNCNFVESFSTDSERKLLISIAKHEVSSAEPASKRLSKILKLMKDINSKVMKTDPGILFPKRQEEMIFYGLVEIDGIRRDDNEIKVDVIVRGIDSQSNLKLISEYEKFDKSKSPGEQDIERIRKEILDNSHIIYMPLHEVHTWFLFDGQWMIKDIKVVLLE